MAHSPDDADLKALASELDGMAELVGRGVPYGKLSEPPDAPALALRQALNRLLQAAALREQQRQQLGDMNQDYLLALEELARDQAAELSRQNDELRAQNKELTRANNMKSEFLTTMSHELRTPLNAVIGFSELLIERISGPLEPEQEEFVRDIRRAGEHLLAMINDILDLAKIDAGRMVYQLQPFDLRFPVREADEIVRSIARKKEQRLELHADAPVPCFADAQRMRQVALNLMGNAVKFTPRQGIITVTVRAADGAAELVVRDSGIGIDPSSHELIFEAFRQVDGSGTREYQGTGLGLALVKRFCLGMNGTIRVDSRRGEGATFTVRLPVRAPDLEGATP